MGSAEDRAICPHCGAENPRHAEVTRCVRCAQLLDDSVRPPTVELPAAPDLPESEESASGAGQDAGELLGRSTDDAKEEPAAKTRRSRMSPQAVLVVFATLLIILVIRRDALLSGDNWRYIGKFWKDTFRDIVRDPFGAPGSLKLPARRQPSQRYGQRAPFGDSGAPPLVGPRMIPGVGLPPLHKAALAGDPEEARRVLQSGADVNAKDADGWTALHWAASCGEVSPVDGLMDMPMPGVPGGPGWGPFSGERQLGEQRKLLRHLEEDSLRHAMPPGSQRPGSSPGGNTADHLAVVRLLLEHGADVDVQTRIGKTPLRLALDGDHTDIADMLQGHGAEEVVTPDSGDR